MKFTTYDQIRNASIEDLKEIDPEDYTDEEFIQIQNWLTQASLEIISEEKLCNLDDIDLVLLGLNSNIILESLEEYEINGRKIIGSEIISYPKFSIIKENGKNNFYRIMHK